MSLMDMNRKFYCYACAESGQGCWYECEPGQMDSTFSLHLAAKHPEISSSSRRLTGA